jgi:general secretion pathway protein G
MRVRARQAGQTLHEVLVIVAVMGALLLGFMLLRACMYKPEAYQRTQIQATRTRVTRYDRALREWQSRPPGAACPATLYELYTGGYVNAAPADAWGLPLVYYCPARDGRAWEVYSKGPDRHDGTEDDIRLAPP